MKKALIIIFSFFFVVIILLMVSKFIMVKTRNINIYSGDTKLAGTIATPRFQKGPFPAIVVVHGSGTDTRKRLRGYWRLTSKGFAVITYDKRGTGESEGDYGPMTFEKGETLLETLAQDTNAVVNYSLEQNEIKSNKIGLIGGSQAGWIMPITANLNPKISYFISISGPAVTFGIEEYFSQLTGDDPGFFHGLTNQEVQRKLENYSGLQGYNPIPELRKLKIPSLWVLGGEDKSVPIKNTIENLNRLENRHLIQIKLFPKGDHSIINSDNGKRINYWVDIFTWLEKMQL